MTQVKREAAVELTSVAPLLAGGQPIGAVTIVASGDQLIGFTSAELLRRNEKAGLAIAASLDGKTTVPIRAWSMGRYTGIGLVELGAALPADSTVTPLPISAVCATVDTRGAPAALVTFAGLRRVIVHVNVDAVGYLDVIARLATAIEPLADDVSIEGAPLFAWFPPERALGRPAATLALAVGYSYRAQTFKPRDRPALADLVGLEDLGRAMSWATGERADPAQVAGEFEDHDLPKSPVE